MVEGCRQRPKQRKRQKRPRTEAHIRLNKGHYCGPCLSIMALQWLKGTAKYWEIDHILNNSNILKQSLSINIPHTVMCKFVLLKDISHT